MRFLLGSRFLIESLLGLVLFRLGLLGRPLRLVKSFLGVVELLLVLVQMVDGVQLSAHIVELSLIGVEGSLRCIKIVACRLLCRLSIGNTLLCLSQGLIERRLRGIRAVERGLGGGDLLCLGILLRLPAAQVGFGRVKRLLGLVFHPRKNPFVVLDAIVMGLCFVIFGLGIAHLGVNPRLLLLPSGKSSLGILHRLRRGDQIVLSGFLSRLRRIERRGSAIERRLIVFDPLLLVRNLTLELALAGM